jgi:hypothetical protein
MKRLKENLVLLVDLSACETLSVLGRVFGEKKNEEAGS